MKGGAGNDRIAGGTGYHVADGGAGDDYVDLGPNRFVRFEDCLAGFSEFGSGGTGDDVLRGEPGTDMLFGGRGVDAVRGGPGHDGLGVIRGTTLSTAVPASMG